MSQSLYALLEKMEAGSTSTRDKGTRFEDLTAAWLLEDDTQSEIYDQVQTFHEWAESQGLPGNDAGIDLVARRRSDGKFTAVQCKFYKRGYTIQKADIDSFISASSKSYFAERILIDTTGSDLGKNAAQMLDGQSIPTRRIGLSQLEESRIDWEKFSKGQAVPFKPKKSPMPHQEDALVAVREGFHAHSGAFGR